RRSPCARTSAAGGIGRTAGDSGRTSARPDACSTASEPDCTSSTNATAGPSAWWAGVPAGGSPVTWPGKHPRPSPTPSALGPPSQVPGAPPRAGPPLADRLKSRFDPTFGGSTEEELGSLPVPSTSIYSRTDGVVRWQVCLDVADATHENVEVRGSHIGLG